MAQTRHVVRVQAGEDADDLVEALSIRGFEARRLEAGEIEVESPDEEGPWRLEVVSALEAWLEEEGRDELHARVGAEDYTVRAPHARAEHEPEPAARRGPDLVLVAAALGALLLLAAGIWLIVAAVSQAI